MTEIVSPKSKLTPLENRDEYLFPNQESEKGFKNNERRLVQERREQYSKKVFIFLIKLYLKSKEKTKIREVVTTNTNERRLRATVVIQKWFKNRQSIISRNTLSERPEDLPVLKNEKNMEMNIKPTNLSESLHESEENKSKKKERRKRGALFFIYLYVKLIVGERQKLQTSLSMSQGIRESSFDSPPFKNAILADSLSKSSKKNSKTEISECNIILNHNLKKIKFQKLKRKNQTSLIQGKKVLLLPKI